MRCKALFLAALLASSAALADPPADAPVAIDVKKGDAAPSDGVFLPAKKADEIYSKCSKAEADRDRYRQQVANAPMPSGSLLLGAGVIGLVLGAIVGGIAVSMAKK